MSSPELTDIASINTEKRPYCWCKRSNISSRRYCKRDRNRVGKIVFENLNILNRYCPLLDLKFQSLSSEFVCPFPIDMERTVFGWNLFGLTFEKYLYLFRSFLLDMTYIDWDDFCSEIERCGFAIQLYGELISFVCIFEFWNEFCTVSSGNQKASSSKGIKCTSVSNFLGIKNLSKLPYYIEACHMERLINQIKHGKRD